MFSGETPETAREDAPRNESRAEFFRLRYGHSCVKSFWASGRERVHRSLESGGVLAAEHRTDKPLSAPDAKPATAEARLQRMAQPTSVTWLGEPAEQPFRMLTETAVA
jgi:hypothetical protein